MSKLKLNDKNTIGTYNIGTGVDNVVNCIMLEPNSGKTYVGGFFSIYNGISQNSLIRLNSDGTNDTTFSSGFENYDQVNCLALDSNGKLYVGGWFYRYSGETIGYGLIRLNEDGTRDMGFDIGGGFNNHVNSIKINSNGKIYLGGSFKYFRDAYQYYLIRLNPDGTKDTDFAINIRPETGGFQENGYITSIDLDTNQKIYACGGITFYNGDSIPHLIRFNINGTKDTGYNPTTGILGTVNYIKLNSSDKLYLGGDSSIRFGPSQGYITRLNSDGTEDTEFNVGSSFNSAVFSIYLDSIEKIYVGGSFSKFRGVTENCLVKLNLDGTKDTSFNTGRGFNNNENGYFLIPCVLVDSNGKVYVGGAFTTYRGMSINYFIRLNSDGSSDIHRTIESKLSIKGTSNTVQTLNFNNDVFVDFTSNPILEGLTEPVSFYLYLDSNNYVTIGMIIYNSEISEVDTHNEFIVFLMDNYLVVQTSQSNLGLQKVDITNYTNQSIFVEIKRTDATQGSNIDYIKFNGVSQTSTHSDTSIGLFGEYLKIGTIYHNATLQYLYKLYDATIWNITIPGRNHWNGYVGNVDSGWLDTIGSNNGSISGTTKTTRKVIVPVKKKIRLNNGYEEEALSLINRMISVGETPSFVRKQAINTAIKSLKENDLFINQFDTLVVTRGSGVNSTKMNWIKNSSNAVGVNNPTYTQDVGYFADPYGSDVRLDMLPKSQGVLTKSNDCSFIFKISGTQVNDHYLGSIGGSIAFTCLIHNGGAYSRIQSSGYGGSKYEMGYNALSRDNGSNFNQYKNSTNYTVTASTIADLEDFYIAAFRGAGSMASSGFCIEIMAAGKAISQSKFNTFQTIMDTYFASI